LILRTTPHHNPTPTINQALANQDLPFTETIGTLPYPTLMNIGTLPIFVLQDHQRPELRFPDCESRLIPERLAQDVPSPLSVEVDLTFAQPSLNVAVRTDVLPLSFTHQVAELYLATLNAGPEALFGV
ncbi:hypothetical protein ACIRRH_38665, partial [Kitasatospora sp. NPDC101235]|uniref:hypothetical protein n=1 Tax=Kitasatospora sp. NPDC101235 TaxID=3364101 RepID=UPI00380958D4